MITPSIKKGENLARQISSKDSMTMNLGISAATFSETDSDEFLFVYFLLENTISCIFFTGPMLYHPPRSPTCVGNVPRGSLFTFIETGIHNQQTQAESNFSGPCQFQVFSKCYKLICNLAVVKFLFSQCV